MKENKWNDNWKFWKEKDAFALMWNVPEDALTVAVPHDAMLMEQAYADSPNKGNTGFRDGGVYHYVKMLDAPENWQGKCISLKFEGVYCNAFVYVNGQLAGKDAFGYNPFTVSIQDFLNYGSENEVRVIVRNGAMTNSRWYSGGGIYRDVYLSVSEPVHIAMEGVRITTETADSDEAVVCFDIPVCNLLPAKQKLSLQTVIRNQKGEQVSSEVIPVVLLSQESRSVRLRMTIENPQLWSAETPDLYTCTCVLAEGDKTVDTCEEHFGIRVLSLSSKKGLRVNGQTVNLRGACIHHDSGLLGAATYLDAQYRQIRILKEAGFNAIRMAHHPMAPAMLQACDELGMYVMDETFDMWTRGKSDYDYSMNFTELWQKDTIAMIQKDYNHPSVIMYSIGNEIPEIGTDLGAKLANEISTLVQTEDPTRYTLASINGVFASGDAIPQIMGDVCAELSQNGELNGNVNDFMTLMDAHLDKIVVHSAISERLEKACAATDIAGYNYMTARYRKDGETYPNRIIVGSETYPPEIARNWKEVKELPYVIGDFTWTGWDYIGEAGVGVPAYRWGDGGFGAHFPCQLAYSGDIEITGVRRPASYFREVVFGLRKEPYVVVQNPYRYGEHLIKTPWVISDSISSWSFPDCENHPVIVEIYAAGDEVELFCNGKSLGKKPSGEAAGYRVLFETVYEPGTLTAVAYEKGSEIGKMELQTAGEASRLEISCEAGKTKELYYLPITLVDADGNHVAGQDQLLNVELSEGLELAGFGSGDPKTAFSYQAAETRTFQGKALLIVKRTEAEGERAVVKIQSESGIEGSLELIDGII